MKLKIVLLLMAASLNIVAMEEYTGTPIYDEKKDLYFVPDTEGFELDGPYLLDIVIRHEDESKPALKIVRDKNKWKAEGGYSFFTFDQTQTADDTKKNHRIKEAVFMALVVEASQSTFDKKPFQELLEKLKNSAIAFHENGNVYITEKDCKHRLLAYIRCCGSDCVINGKRTEISDLLFDDEVVSSGVEYYIHHNLFGKHQSYEEMVKRFNTLAMPIRLKASTQKKQRDDIFMQLRHNVGKSK